MFKLIKLEDRIWGPDSYEENPSMSNGFELYKFKDEADFNQTLWEMRCETAESYGDYDEAEQEFGEFVEDNSEYIAIDYDPANPVHVTHTGFEEERPEHVEWLKAERKRALKESINRCTSKVKQYKILLEACQENLDSAIKSLEAYKTQLEHLNNES